MRSVADALRRDTVERVLAMAPRERIALALALGDDDLLRFMRARRCGRDEALGILKARRASGRVASRSALPDR